MVDDTASERIRMDAQLREMALRAQELKIRERELALREREMALQEQRMQWEMAQQRTSATVAAPVPRTPPIPTAPKQTVWGGMVKGAKKITKYVFVAVVLTAAFMFATGFLTAFAAANPAFMPGVIEPILGFMQATCSAIYNFTGAAGTYLSSFSIASASPSAGIGTTAIAASALGGAAVVAKHQTAVQMAAIPDIDPSTLTAATAKKTVAANASLAQQPSMDTNAIMALPDGPREVRMASEVLQGSQAQTAAMSKTAAAIKTAAHVAADETHDVMKHRSAALDRIRQAHAEKASWVERIDQPVASDIARR